MKFSIFPINGGITAAQGFLADGIAAGFKKDNALDIAFIYAPNGFKASAVFTKNTFCAAPIVHYRQMCKEQNCQILNSNFVLINTKNANAMTGADGVRDIDEILSALKGKFQNLNNPIMSSTGVIGVRLDKQKIIASFDKFDLSICDENAHARAADAIRTTDAFSKEIALEVKLENGKAFRIGAMCKGAGMIAPSLATMLCFVATDADVPDSEMSEILARVATKNFDAISVDGDMSTNDSVFLLSNGKSGAWDSEAFETALDMALHKLALDIVRDGEGSSRVVAFEVKNALSAADAKKAAKALSNSLLVKTAIFGGDPNWGRIASTIGASGVSADCEKLSIFIGDVCVFDKGAIIFTPDVEAKAAAVMKNSEFRILCDLGFENLDSEKFCYTAYGCDLGHKYVEINSDYRS